MKPLKQSQEIIDLGKKLVEEFNSSGSCTTTTRWMAHYVAELIGRIETEKSPNRKKTLQQECCEVILKLWNNRNSFVGDVKPLANLREPLSILKALKNNTDDFPIWRSFREAENLTPWGKFMKHIRDSSDDLLRISLASSVLKEDMLKEKDWLKFKSFISKDEYEIIKSLDTLLGFHEYNPIVIDPRESKKQTKDKKDQIIDKLLEIIESQKAEVLQIKKELFKK